MAYFRLLLIQWFMKPQSWLALGVLTMVSALFFNGFYFSYLNQQTSTLQASATAQITLSQLGVMVLINLLYIPIVTMSIFCGDITNRRISLIAGLPMSSFKLFLSKASVAIVLCMIPNVLCALFFIPLNWATSLDHGLIISNFIGLFLISIQCCAIGLWASSTSRQPTAAAMLTYVVILVFWLLEASVSSEPAWLGVVAEKISMIGQLRDFREGIIRFSALMYYLLLTTFFLTLAYFQFIKKLFLRSPQRVTIFFNTMALLFMLWISGITNIEIDISRTKSASLSASYVSWAQQIDQPITITAYTTHLDTKDEIKAIFRPFIKASKHIRLAFSAPAMNRAETSNISMSTVIQFASRDNKHYLQYPFTTSAHIAIKQGISKLFSENIWIAFSEDYGEKKLQGKATTDISTINKTLLNNHYHAKSISLDTVVRIPDNVTLLALVSPKENLTFDAWKKVKEFLEKGGSLLWMQDPEFSDLNPMLSQYLGIDFIAGTVMDENGTQRGTPSPAIVLVDDYPTHPITHPLKQLAAIPWSGAISIKPSEWDATTLLASKSSTWLELSEDEKPHFDENEGDLRGSFSLAVALERQVIEQSQRIVVIASSHFISDGVIHNYGNKQLIEAIFQWLAPQKEWTLATPSAYLDAQITPIKFVNQMFIYFYPWVLPGLLFLMGSWVFISRRKLR
ncbi:MAG: Gldg family protein [Pseudomonadota bacterium]